VILMDSAHIDGLAKSVRSKTLLSGLAHVLGFEPSFETMSVRTVGEDRVAKDHYLDTIITGKVVRAGWVQFHDGPYATALDYDPQAEDQNSGASVKFISCDDVFQAIRTDQKIDLADVHPEFRDEKVFEFLVVFIGFKSILEKSGFSYVGGEPISYCDKGPKKYHALFEEADIIAQRAVGASGESGHLEVIVENPVHIAGNPQHISELALYKIPNPDINAALSSGVKVALTSYEPTHHARNETRDYLIGEAAKNAEGTGD